MNFDELILKRESCRNFNGAAVSEGELEAMVNAARLAPSACNSQPWHFYAVTEGEKKEALASCVQEMGMNKFASAAGALIVVTEEPAKLSQKIVSRIASQEFAPGDIGIAVAHLVLKAADMGLETCILGWLNEKRIRCVVDIPQEAKIKLVIAVGHTDEVAPRPKKRRELSEVYTLVK